MNIKQFLHNQQPRCTLCNSPGTQTHPLTQKSSWLMCQPCIAQTTSALKQYKQSRKHIYPEIEMIVDGLYLGNEDAAIDWETVRKYEIGAICVCGSDLETPFEQKKVENKFGNILYRKHQIDDFPQQKIIHLFDQNCDWIQEKLAQGRKVLLHCAAGVSRSASFVIAYLMNKKGMLYPDAFRAVKERRRVISPNSGFRVQLEQYGRLIIERGFGSKCVQGEGKEKKEEQQKQQKGEDKMNQIGIIPRQQ